MVTKGIWLWHKPIPLKDGDITLIVIDTEGLGSTVRNQTADTRIFALALLLSSYFVYNSRGLIDGNAIEGTFLSFFLSYRYISLFLSYRYISFFLSYRYISFLLTGIFRSFFLSYRYISFFLTFLPKICPS